MTSARNQAYLALLTTTIIWGFASPIIKYSFGFTTPLTFLFYRFLIVSLVLLIPLIWRLKKIKPTKNQVSRYLLLGFMATPLNLILLFVGLKRTTAIDATLISVTSPILIILGGAFLLKEKVTRQEKTGISLTLAGTMVTILQPLMESNISFGQNILGNFLVFLGAIEWSAFTLLTKKFKKLDPFVLTASSFILGLVLFTPLFLFQSQTAGSLFPQTPAIWGILYMALLGSIVAYFTHIWGLSKIEASEAAVFTYLQPLFAVPLAAIWLKETITFPFLIGGILIGTGVIIAERRA